MLRTLITSILLVSFLIGTSFIAFTVMMISIEQQVLIGGIISLIMIFIVSSICTSSIVRIKRSVI
ncbi:hypothetical protein [Alkalicoccobacillus gibsonii]|uniref:hypothetical protein n=1 Tax=Alkalicoccobacillus gibsonii TaxID=79881 RepID=UPI0019327A62|nr:hypothetical protein [Alkalicoccobacillus gibsonii]MBM0066754.1 hypothetical protein [Alkalicoccobacillus gibsonii]